METVCHKILPCKFHYPLKTVYQKGHHHCFTPLLWFSLSSLISFQGRRSKGTGNLTALAEKGSAFFSPFVHWYFTRKPESLSNESGKGESRRSHGEMETSSSAIQTQETQVLSEAQELKKLLASLRGGGLRSVWDEC